MKKSVSLKLIVFSFLLAANVTYSAPEFQTGSGTDSTVAGFGNKASGENSSAFGFGNKASEEGSSAFGYRNEASEISSFAFGFQNKASGYVSSAFGFGNKASGSSSSAFGSQNNASGSSSSAFGYRNEASGSGSSAVGYNNTASGRESSAFGTQYKVTGNASGAFGVGNATWNRTTQKYDYAYINEGKNSYMFGNYNKIAAGTQNNFILGNNVSIGSGINNSVALGNNSTVSSSNEVSVGSATVKRRITNVGDGEYSATSTDAVNGKQLYGAIKGVEGQINNVKSEVAHVGSLSAALAGLHPMQYDPKAPTQVMAALGHYKNKQSVAVGLGYYFNDRFMMTAGVAIGSEKRMKSMANVGFTLKLGKGSGVTEEDSTPIQNEVKKLNIENKELRSKLEAQDEKIKRLEEKLDKISNK